MAFAPARASPWISGISDRGISAGRGRCNFRDHEGRRAGFSGAQFARLNPENPGVATKTNRLPNRRSACQRIDHRRGAWETVSYTHLRAHETVLDIVCRLL